MRNLVLEPLEDRILYSAEPVATVAAVSEEFINDDFTFTVEFDNAAPAPVNPGDPDNVGYAPFVDVTVEPGITVNSVSYLGTSATLTQVGTWDGTQWVNGSNQPITQHPYGAGLDLPPGNQIGDTWYRVDLPFGSFTPNQPVAPIQFDATLDEAEGAVVGAPLEITAQAGFRFGNDPLNNPLVDPPLQQDDPDIFSVTPTVMELEKQLLAPESETATGPNFERGYRLVVDIADGQTIENLNITDLLPPNVVLTSAPVITGGGSYSDNSTLTIGSPASGNQFDITFDSVTGTASAEDIVIEFTFYVPEFDANGDPVLDPVSGADSIAFNAAEATGEYHPNGGGTPFTVSDTGSDGNNEVELQLEALVIQKGATVVDNGSPGYTVAGDYIDYALDFQVSDYFSVDSLVITDTLSDGQRIPVDGSGHPTGAFALTLSDNGNPLSVNIDPAYIDVTTLPTGEQQIVIHLSDFLATQPGFDGTLDGDQYDLDGATGGGTARDSAGDGGTVGTITYRAQIQINFEDDFPSGDQSVDLNDVLGNQVVIAGRVAGTANDIADDSGTETSISPWESEKVIYAINGDTNFSNTQIAPGDSVTYRVTITLPAADIEDLTLTDFLPLPVFDVGTQFAGVTSVDLYSGNPPPAGTISYGAGNTLFYLPGDNGIDEGGGGDDIVVTPVVSIDAASNQISVDFGTFNDVQQTGVYTIELLYTVTATDRPFADNLLLTNQAVISSGTTNNGPQQQTEIRQITLRQPTLNLTKGVLSADSADPSYTAGNTTGSLPGTFTSDDLASNPIDADVSGVDAGDTVTFAITVTNSGGEDAFDIVLTDSPPPGFVIPSDPNDLELTITRGDGTTFTFTGLGANGNALDLFTPEGIRIDDPALVGALQAAGTDGTDVIVVTYKLVASESVVPGVETTNTAHLESFAAQEGGYDFTQGVDETDFTDSASTTFDGLAVAKDIVATDQAFTSGSDLAIGEVATYHVTITLPEGTIPADGITGIGLNVSDNVPAGFEIIPGSITLVSSGFGGTIRDSGGTVLSDGATLVSSGSGNNLSFDFGEINTTGDNDTGNNAFVIEYQVRPREDAGLTDGQELTNTVTVDSPTDNAPPVSDSATATVLLPDIVVVKDVDASAVDGGDPVSYTIVIRNDGSTDAFDVTFSDDFPSALNSVTLVSAVSSANGDVASYFQLGGNALTQVGTGFTLVAGESITLTVTADVNELETNGLTITNTATATGTSLPGDHPDEEYSDTDSDDATFQIAAPTITKTVVDSSIGGDDGLATIGETVTYDIVITVPEATVPLHLTDAIPAGMSLVSATVISIDPNISGSSISAGATITSGPIDFDFGTVTNSSDGNNVPDQILVRVVLKVDNVAGNQGGQLRDNVATIDYGAGSNSDDASITLVEPNVTIDKVANPTTGLDAGDTVTYTVTLTNTGSSTAYDIDFSDTFPGTLDNVQLTAVGGTGGYTTGDFSVAGNSITSVAGNLDLAVGQTIVLTVTGVLTDAVEPDQTIANTATITWSSLDGTSADERDGGGGVDDYNASDGANVLTKTVFDLAKALSSGQASTATIGETVSYDLTLTLNEGTTDNVTISDTLPAGMTYVDGSLKVMLPNGDEVEPDSVTYVGNLLTIHFDSVTIPGDNVTTNNTLLLSYDATVDNVVENQSGTTLTNVASATGEDADGSALTDNNVAEPTVTVVEPVLGIVKSVSPTTADAGDTVTYTVTITNTGNSEAFDIDFSDTFPAHLTNVQLTGVGGTGGATLGQFQVVGNAVTSVDDTLDLAVGQTIVLTITAELTQAVGPDETITNEATVTWTSLDGVVTGERDGSDGPGPDGTTLNNYSASDDADVDVPVPTITKTVVDTSSSGTTGSNATIGETVTYDIVITVPEGTVPLHLTDVIPAGMSLVSAEVISIDPSISGSSVAEGATITSGPIDFDFGTLSNAADDGDTPDQIVVRVVLKVDNLVENQYDPSGTTDERTNIATIDYGSGTASDDAVITIAEPVLSVTKTASPTTGLDAGDTVTYTITIANSGNATAYELTLDDVLPPSLTNVQIASVTGATIGDFLVSGNEIGTDNAALQLAAGGQIVLTVTATLTDAVEPDQTIANTASINWSSLEGDDPDERTGDDGEGPDGTTLNNYADSDDVEILTKTVFDLTKALSSGQASTATIGETVSYDLTLTLNEGTTDNITISDTLPAGMTYVPGSLAVTIPGVGTVVPDSVTYDIDIDSGSGLLTIHFDSVTIPGDNVTSNNTLLLSYDATVDNVVENQSGTTLTNVASATGEDADGSPLTDNNVTEPTVTVVEPVLGIVKSVSPGTADAGDIVTYTVTITNTGNSTAYDIDFGDTLPIYLTNVQLTGVAGTGGATPGQFQVTGNSVTSVDDTLDLAVGQTIVLTITGQLTGDVSPDLTITNEATVTWTSLDGVVVGERDGSDGPGPDGTTLNNYSASDDADVEVPVPTISKTVVDTSSAGTTGSDATIGETVTYDIVITVPEGTMPLHLTDAIPPGMSLVSATVVAIDPSISGSLLGAGASITSGPVDLDFGIIVNGFGDGDTADQIVVRVVLKVDNVAGNQADPSGTTDDRTNTATIDYGSGTASDDAVITIAEPVVSIDKAASPTTGLDAGDTVTYTITLTNTGSSTAFDIDFSDTFPGTLNNVQLTAVGGTGGFTTSDFSVAGNAITSVAGNLDLAVGQTIVLTVTGVLTEAVEPDQTIANTATITWSSLDGTSADERNGADGPGPDGTTLNNYSDSDDAEVTTTTVFDLSKALADGQASTATIGETVSYDLTLTLLEGTTDNITISDTLPAGMTYVDGSLKVMLPNGDEVEPDSVSYDSGLLTIHFDSVTIPGDNVTTNNTLLLTYDATVDNELDNQDGTTLTNSASATGEDADGDPLEDSDVEEPTVTVVEPVLTIDKSADPTSGLDAGDTVTYTITITNTGTSTAYDIDFSDSFPGFLENVQLTGVAGTGGFATTDFTVAGNAITSIHGNLDLAVGDTIVLTVTGTLTDAVEQNQTIDNTATITWSSLDGDVAGERDGADGPGPDGTTLDNYSASDDAEITTTTVFDLVKSLQTPAQANAAIGETVGYQLSLELIEGTTEDVTIGDTMASGMSYVDGSLEVRLGGLLLTENVDYTLTAGPAGFTVTMTNPVVVTGDNDGSNNFLVVTYDAVIDDVVGNTANTELINDAAATGSDANDQPLGDDDAVTVTVIEPTVTLDKSLVGSTTGYDAGDTVTYGVTLTGSGGATAYDLVFSDVLGPEFSWAAADVSITGPDAGLFSYDETTHSISVAPGTDLADGATLAFTLQVKLVATVEPNQSVGNSVTLDWTSQDGDVDGERSYDTSDDAENITIDNTFLLTKAFGDGQAASATIGEQVDYKLTLELIEGVTENVQVVDDLPDGMDLVGTEVMVSISGGTPFAVSVTPPGPGGQIVIDLGDVTIPDDNDAGNNQVVITYTTVVKNQDSNYAGQLLQNEASATGEDANGDPLGDDADDEPELRIVEPMLDINKTVTPMSGLDAGDTVTYTITISNPTATYGADAFDLQLTDLLPPEFTPGSGPGDFTVTGASPSAFTLVGNSLSSDGQIDLAMGAPDIVITIVGTLNTTVQPGEIVENTASLTWSSLDDQGTAPTDDERDGADGPGGALDDYAVESTASLLTDTVFEIAKTLAGGGLSQDATIGETVNYALTLTLIEGTTHDVVVYDQLPAGLAYDGQGVSITIAGSTVAVPSGQIAYDSGTGLLTITLGDVTIPADGDTDNNVAVLAYGAVVENVTGNQSGTTLTNSASAEGTDGGGGELGDESDSEPTVTVIEPLVTIDKVASPTTGLDAGDTVTYTITLTNTGSSTAFDIDFSDTFPATLSNVQLVSVGGTGGFATSDFTVAGNAVTSIHGNLDLAVGDSIVLTVTGVLTDAVEPDQTIDNTATVTWSSLDGDVTGERDGSDGPGPDGSVLNNYNDSDDAEVTTTTVFDLSKALADGQASTATIGETVSYDLTLTLNEGTTDNITISDMLPAGMTYVDGSLKVMLPNGDEVAPDSVTYDSGLLTIHFNSVTIPGDNVTTNNTLLLTYDATVDNELDNQDGTTLTNSASATGEDADGDPLEDTDVEEPTVTVVEPVLSIDKSADPTSGLDAGDTVTYTITITNTGTSTAYDIDFSDSFPSFLTDVQLASVGGTGGFATTDFTVAGNAITSVHGNLDLAVGDSIVLTVTGVLTDAVEPDQTIDNTATVTWSSLDGDVAGERDGADGPGPDGTTLDNYSASDDAEVTTTTVFDLVKSLAAGENGTATIGETVSYDLALTLGEGTTQNITITDTLPAGMEYVGGSLAVSIPGVGAVTPTSIDYDSGTGVLTVIFASVVIPGDNDTTNNTLLLAYDAVVQDVVDNVRGTELDNAATATGEDADGDPLEDGGEPDDTTTVVVTEPDLDIVKTVDDDTPEPGQVITYSVTVSHNAASDADAMDVLIGDLITDPNLTLVAGSVQLSGSAAGGASVVSGNTSGDTAIQVSLASLAQGDSITITYQVTVAADAGIIGDILPNTATVDYDTIAGEDQPEERDYSEQDDAEVQVLSPDLAVDKSVDVGVLVPGTTAQYTLAIDNNGDVGSNTATNVVVTDVLPLGLTYVGVTGTPPGATVDFDAGTRTLTISGFDMDAGDHYDIVIEVAVDDPAPPGADYDGQADDETLTNVADITADNFEPTPEDNEDEVPLVLEAAPDLTVTKVADVTSVVNQGQITYTITVANQGNQVSTGVVVTDQIDTSVVDVVSVSGGGSYDSDTGVITWNLSSLSPDDGPQVYTVVVQVKDTVPAGPNTVDNAVHVQDDGQSGPESDTTNNDDEVEVTLISVPDLEVVKEVSSTKAIQGDALTYTITVTNHGLQGATGVVITDDLPAGIKFLSASDGGTYDPQTGEVTWDGISLAAGESMTVTLEVRIPDLYRTGNMLNTATVHDDGANGPDATPEDNTSTVSTKVDARYVYNALNGNIFEDDEDEDPFGRPWDWRPPLLPIDPIYSGSANPGTQIRLEIYSDRGSVIASQFVMADTGGNWLASFPGAVIQDRPHEVRVIQDASINATGGFLFNFRTYFSPAANPQQFFSEVGGVGGLGSYPGSDLMQDMIEGFLHPVFQPNQELYFYEFLPSSSTTTQYAN